MSANDATLKPTRSLNVKMLMQLSLVALLLAVWIALGLSTDTFATPGNITNLLRQTAIGGVLAIGQTFVIITAGIDLSVGSVVAVTGVTLALLASHGMPLVPAIFLALLLGFGIGMINAFAIHKLGLPPFIATLAMLSVARGSALLLTGGQSISMPSSGFTTFSTTNVGPVPSLFVVLLLVAAVGWVLLHRSRWGRYVFAYGSNKEAARLSGVNIGAVVFFVYGISALCAAIGGVLVVSRIGVGVPTAGTGYELDSIAASVIGGSSLFGGEGGVFGTILGALLITTISNGANLLGVDPFWQQIITGLLIAVIVYLDQLRKRREG
ncbi:ABC transporter permease [Deinococcus sp. KSM4-11]|uniref:ABC transporter permease n=1 Tax=Deinococcus sp. KSM4-11 TaxID=2568654 RepID=UPI0010A2EAE8|nr:ABC transporter permease [Deinococcus sp. KSM4-11]THF87369.1 ABC transporter permease [Deinococcus sp. KSM4-11]